MVAAVDSIVPDSDMALNDKTSERAAAWDELHADTPPGWYAGRLGQRHGGSWAMYAFDTTEKAHVGRRSREWTAVGQTEAECVREMARCLREISEGRVPK